LKLALVMELCDADADAAARLLDAAGGRVRAAVADGIGRR
jgi:N-acetylmuramic acid 6-phosphate (MurNAc-6-P) etherase